MTQNTPHHEAPQGFSEYAEFSRVASVLGERLRAMEDSSRERNDSSRRIEAKLDAQAGVLQSQQIQITQLTADVGTIKSQGVVTEANRADIGTLKQEIAVLQTRHDSFWRGVTILVSVVTAIGAIVGWLISQIVTVWPHGGH